MIFFSLISFFLFSFPLKALEIVSINGASQTEISSSSPTDVTVIPTVIYGGEAGQSCPDVDNVTTCNSCALGGNEACNLRSVYPTLKLRIEFTSNQSGKAVLVDGTKLINEEQEERSFSAGQKAFVEVTWGDLCKKLNNDEDPCSKNFSKKLQLGINSSGELDTLEDYVDVTIFYANPYFITSYSSIHEVENCHESDANDHSGICEFNVYPGDGEVFLEKIKSPDPLFPLSSGDAPEFSSIRVMYSSSSSHDATTNGTFQDLAIVPAGDGFRIVPNKISGLENGVTYYFRLGVVDKAGNLYFIMSDYALEDLSCEGCKNHATPGEIAGFLFGDKNCFITTATYGSHSHEKVETFRRFRNEILLSSRLGVELILAYYEYGPKASFYLMKFPILKKISRILLFPMWVFAKISLKMGVLGAFLTLLSLFLFIILLSQRFVLRWFREGNRS